MFLRLLLDTFLRIDQEERGFRARRARDHVFQELLVAGGVNDDVLAILPLKKRARGVNRDALFLLLEEGIEQEGIFEFLALALANTPDLLQLAFRKRTCIREQAAQQCGFSMVHMADDDDFKLFRGSDVH